MNGRTYKTRQREEILAVFEAFPDRCFSARELITEASLAASQATVYRTLTVLANEGLIRRFKSAVGGDCYKLACRKSDHIHFVCTSCGELLHSDCKFISELSEHLQSCHGFRLDTGNTVIYGLCAKCSHSEGDE